MDSDAHDQNQYSLNTCGGEVSQEGEKLKQVALSNDLNHGSFEGEHVDTENVAVVMRQGNNKKASVPIWRLVSAYFDYLITVKPKLFVVRSHNMYDDMLHVANYFQLDMVLYYFYPAVSIYQCLGHFDGHNWHYDGSNFWSWSPWAHHSSGFHLEPVCFPQFRHLQ